MRLGRLFCWALASFLVVTAANKAADKQKSESQSPSGPPTVAVRVRSINTVIENAKLLARLFGKEDVGEQVEALIKSRVGPNGLEGVDLNRPFGVYTRIRDDLSEAAVIALVPIADEKAFLGLLENLNFKAEKGKDGLYTVQQELVPFRVGFRFAHHYAYVTAVNLQALAPGRLVAPGLVFPPGQAALVSATVRLDQVPQTAKDLALAKMEEGLERAKEKRERGESEAQHQARIIMLDAFARQMKEIFKDGKELDAQLDINAKGEKLAIEMALDAQPGSVLAADIRKLGQEKSLFPSLLTRGAALNGLTHVILPEEIRKALDPVIDEGLARAVKEEPNEAKREQVAKIIKAVAPSLKAGEFDGALSLRGPSAAKRYTLVLGVKLRQGGALETTLRQLLKAIPEEDREKIHLDAASADGIKIHRVNAQKTFDKKARAAFGDNPVYVAIRPDALFVALGENGLEAIKQAVTGEPGPAPPFVLEVSVARLAQSFGTREAEKKAAREAFTGTDSGLVRLTVTGGPALRLRLSTALSVLHFGGMTYQKSRENPDDEGSR
jgi:hypothetical protein